MDGIWSCPICSHDYVLIRTGRDGLSLVLWMSIDDTQRELWRYSVAHSDEHGLRGEVRIAHVEGTDQNDASSAAVDSDRLTGWIAIRHIAPNYARLTFSSDAPEVGPMDLLLKRAAPMELSENPISRLPTFAALR